MLRWSNPNVGRSRVHIAQLCLILSMLCGTGCKHKTSDPARLIEASERAEDVIWKHQKEAADISDLPQFYDSALFYYSRAAHVEQARRLLTNGVASLQLLAPEHLTDDATRNKAKRTLSEFHASEQALRLELDTIKHAYARCVTRALDSAFLAGDPERTTTEKELLRADLLLPIWRNQYDSLETETTERFEQMLALFDDINERVLADSVLIFSSVSDAAAYNMLAHSVDSLAGIEATLLKPDSTAKQGSSSGLKGIWRSAP
jgi:hypothetical protein